MEHNTLNYIEIPVSDLTATKAFFSAVFGWEFKDYGPDYTCFLDAGINGGFYTSEQYFSIAKGCPLIVFYSKDIEQTQVQILAEHGKIVKEIFSFPGGRRFHFNDPNGNEYAVWSE
jgi:hypothetical protein